MLVQDRTAPDPGWVVMASVVEADDVVTVLPPTSSTVTTGWVPNVLPMVAEAGEVVTTSFDAAPIPRLKLDEVAEVRPLRPRSGCSSRRWSR